MKSPYWALQLIKSLYTVLAILTALVGLLGLGIAASNGRFGEGLLPLAIGILGGISLFAIAQGIGLALDIASEVKTQTAIQKQLLATLKKRGNGG